MENNISYEFLKAMMVEKFFAFFVSVLQNQWKIFIHIGKKISQSFNVGSKQNIVLFHNKNKINNLDFNNKEKDKYHLNENIHYKSIIENERKEKKLKNQHYEYGSLLNNNFKNGSKFLIRNNLCINLNNSTNRHDSTSINKSNNIFGEINQLYPPRTFTNY